MSFPKILVFFSLVFLGIILLTGTIKFFFKPTSQPKVAISTPIEVVLKQETQTVVPALATNHPEKKEEHPQVIQLNPAPSSSPPPEADLVERFFVVSESKFPIVETVTYKSHVPWQKGRPAWLSDYATHYQTSRHFIARSLNGKPDYLKQEVSEGDHFNVLKPDKRFHFHLIVDTSRCKMWFYYIDDEENKKTLVKTYAVGLGRLDSSKPSGLLTPLGKYTLGDRVVTYKPKSLGNYRGQKIEMISVFGTRWIPFDKEIGLCTAPSKGFGIHGTPWVLKNGQWVESEEGIGKYESDGCIRLKTSDIEELFAIIISRPTIIEIVRDFYESTLLKDILLPVESWNFGLLQSSGIEKSHRG